MVDSFAFADLPDEVIGFKYPFPRLARALQTDNPVRIVAMGSSSTAGRADVVPYPHWLEMYLRVAANNPKIDVLNRGRGNEEANDELLRFDADIFDEAPSLVIWQVGTNAVFRQKEFNFDDVAAAIVSGLDWLAGLEADVVLMDPQYTTAVVTPADQLTRAEDMVARISAAADNAGVNLLPRFALMRHWVRNDGIPLDDLVRLDDPDKLHMSDWATNCMSMALFQAIEQGVAGQGAT
jgi:hypothetical protein